MPRVANVCEKPLSMLLRPLQWTGSLLVQVSAGHWALLLRHRPLQRTGSLLGAQELQPSLLKHVPAACKEA